MNFPSASEHTALPSIPLLWGWPTANLGDEGLFINSSTTGGDTWALKVFLRQYREPRLVGQSERIRPYTALSGLRACERQVLTGSRHPVLLREHAELAYAVLMPWIHGRTWTEIMLSDSEWSANDALHFASNLADVLANMEQRGLAHCDLSGPNVILTPDKKIELVDLEEFYSSDLVRPGALPGGSPGYAHRTAPEGLWHAEADRFSGAILIAEILAWSDESIREGAWGEGYFDPAEMQEDNDRFLFLTTHIENRWGVSVRSLFERAWESDTLGLCPTFAEWAVALPDKAKKLSKETIAAQAIEIIGSIKADVAVSEEQQEHINELHPDYDKTWNCPVCGREVDWEYVLCPYCERGQRGKADGEREEAGEETHERILQGAKKRALWIAFSAVLALAVFMGSYRLYAKNLGGNPAPPTTIVVLSWKETETPSLKVSTPTITSAATHTIQATLTRIPKNTPTPFK
jgi:serine/threonine protein kinase